MIDRVKIALYVDIYNVGVPTFKLSIHTPERVMATASGTKSVALISKAMLVNGFEHHAHGLLHHSVGNRRDAQRARFFTAELGDLYPFHWLGLIAALF